MTHSKPRASKPNLRAQGPPGSGLNPMDGARQPVSLAGRARHNSEPVESTRSCLARPSNVGSGTSWPNLLNLVSAGVGPCRGLQRANRGSDPRNWGSLQKAKGRQGAQGGLGPSRGPWRWCGPPLATPPISRPTQGIAGYSAPQMRHPLGSETALPVLAQSRVARGSCDGSWSHCKLQEWEGGENGLEPALPPPPSTGPRPGSTHRVLSASRG